MLIRINKVYFYFFSLVVFMMSTLFQSASGIHILFGYTTIIIGIITIFGKRIKLNYKIILVQLLNFLFLICCFMPRNNFYVNWQKPSVRNMIITVVCIAGNFFVAAYLMRYMERKHIILLLYLTFVVSLVRILFTYSITDIVSGIRGNIRLGDEIYAINELGIFFSILALFFVYRVMSKTQFMWLEIFFCVICVLFVLMTGSRMAFLVLSIGMLGMFIRSHDFKSGRNLIIVLIMTILVVIVFLQGSDAVLYIINRVVNIVSRKERSLSDSLRRGLILYGLRMWTEYPVVGHGLDRFRVLSPYKAYAHNNYIELLFDYGIIGLLLYYIPRVIVMVSVVRYIREHSDDKYAWFIFVTLCTLLLSDISCVSYISDNQFPFWLACSFLGNNTQFSNQQKNKVLKHNILH